MSSSTPLSEIMRTMELYFEAAYTGNTTQLRSIFDSAAHIIGYDHGTFTRQTLDEWMLEIQGLPKPSEQGEPFDMKVVTVDASDTVALVKTSELYMGLRFNDFMTLVKFEDGWKITHKAFRHD